MQSYGRCSMSVRIDDIEERLMPLNFYERFGVWLMRLGMQLANIDYVDAKRQFTFKDGYGSVSQGFWKRR